MASAERRIDRDPCEHDDGAWGKRRRKKPVRAQRGTEQLKIHFEHCVSKLLATAAFVQADLDDYGVKLCLDRGQLKNAIAHVTQTAKTGGAGHL